MKASNINIFNTKAQETASFIKEHKSEIIISALAIAAIFMLGATYAYIPIVFLALEVEIIRNAVSTLYLTILSFIFHKNYFS